MRILLNILTLIAILVTLLFAANLLWGLHTKAFANGAGMAIVGLSLLTGIAALAAFVLGVIGRIADKRAPRKVSFISHMGIAIGVLWGLVYFGMLALG